MSALMKKEHFVSSEPFMAFIRDDITTRSLGDIVKGWGWNETRIFEGGIKDAIETLRDIATPELLVIDLSDCMDPIDQISELAGICDAGVRLVCLGTINDVQLYRELLDMGVEDYLLKPIDPETLSHAIERAHEVVVQKPVVNNQAEGDVISVIGALGGVGASSFALNMAWDISQTKNKRVALVDLDLHFGTIALSMDLEPGKGFREALENPSRIDSLFLDRAMVKVNDRLSLLACETDIGTRFKFDSAALDLLIERLRQKYDLVIIDVVRSLLPECGDMLARLGKVVVVTDLSLAGMRDGLRISHFAKDHMIEDNLLLVANRVGENKERELGVKEFEKGVEQTLKCIIPFDAKGFGRAEMEGSPVLKVAEKSKAGLVLHSFFDGLIASDETKKDKRSIWRKIFTKS
jgi:pilus assembly protein CpaE